MRQVFGIAQSSAPIRKAIIAFILKLRSSPMPLDAQQQQQILDRFNSDEGFRKRVLDDANKAVKEEFGLDLPFPIRVVLEARGYRIEPVSGSTDDLTDDQLE